MNIARLLQEQARSHPDKTAIMEYRQGRNVSMSFSELAEAVGLTARILQEAGLQPGGTTLFLSPMTSGLYVALLALFQLGGIALFLDPSSGRKHIEQCLEIRGPDALIATSRAHLLRLISRGLRRIPRKFSLNGYMPGALRLDRLNDVSPLKEIAPCTADTPALITFTSGSTGKPKAALRTHGFLRAQHRVLEKSFGLSPGLVDFTTLPIFLLANLASGVCSVIPNCDLRRPGFIKPGPVLRQIAEFQPHLTAASPAFLESLASVALRAKTPLHSFRRIFTGGAPVFPGTLDLLSQAAPEANIVAVYGSTEAEPIAQIATSEISLEDRKAMREGKGLLAGYPVEALQLRILPNAWGEPIGPYSPDLFEGMCLGPGQTGEIVVYGDHVLPSYLDGVGDEETKFDVGGQRWHRTGDGGYLDETGRLWLVGRCAAWIRDDRGTLYPFAVEVAAQEVKGIRRSALVAHQGKRILVLQPGVSGESIDLQMLKQQLSWAQIDYYHILRQIPMDQRHNAKIDYLLLKQELGISGDKPSCA